ncbi:MAG: hypothetical protein ACI3XM_10105 [Eubacteriales bacterium]
MACSVEKPLETVENHVFSGIGFPHFPQIDLWKNKCDICSDPRLPSYVHRFTKSGYPQARRKNGKMLPDRLSVSFPIRISIGTVSKKAPHRALSLYDSTIAIFAFL